MNILIAGASGFIGIELVKALQAKHAVTVLGRDLATLKKKFTSDINKITWESLSQQNAERFNVVVNLCGYNIAQSRWSEAVKKKIIDSRVETNKKLINWLISQQLKPHYICANAVGIYGLQDKNSAASFDENTPIDFEHPKDFLSEVGIAWEQSLAPAINYGMPVTITRFGVVLKKDEGMLKKLEPAFRFGLGSVLGDGKQIISWVHIDDVIASILFLINQPNLTGAFNVTSPNPIEQGAFAHALARALKRPLLLKTPAFVIKTLFGEMGECLLLEGQRVIPTRIQEAGYTFKYLTLADALNKEYPLKN
ncbi:MAG: TIGR01777 family oxidoreductase [Gammaproteobacteria bacterium]